MRKLRFAPPSWHTGKRGATRVIYALFPVHSHVYFVLLYGKNEQGNLTAAQKAAARSLMQRINVEMRGVK